MLREAIETLKAAMDDARARLPGEWYLYIMSSRVEETCPYAPYLTWAPNGTRSWQEVWQRGKGDVDITDAIDAFIARKLAERDAVDASKPTPDQLAATLGV